MKYRNKYQAKGSVGASYGRNNAPPPPPADPTLMDHIIDVGEFALNTTLTPFETITGTNFYDPKFESNFMQNTSDITSAVVGAGTDIAGTMIAGPLYHAGKFGLTKGSRALGLKDNTHSDHNAWAEKTASTIGFVGDAAGVLAGGVAEHGGNIKKRPKAQYGWNSFMQGQPRFASMYNFSGPSKGLGTYSFGADFRNCWGGSCRDAGGGQFLSGFYGNMTPYKGLFKSNFRNPTTGEMTQEDVEKWSVKGDVGWRKRLNLDFYGLGSPSGIFAEGFGGLNLESNIATNYGGKAGLQFKSRRPQKLPTFGSLYMPTHANYMPQWNLDLYAKYKSNEGKSLGADFRYGALGAGFDYNLDTKKPTFKAGLNWNFERGGAPKKYQTTGSIFNTNLGLGGYDLGYNNLGMNMFNNNAGSLQFPELSTNISNMVNTDLSASTFQPSNFNITPSNFGDPGTWGQNTIPTELGGGTYSTTSDYWRPFTTEKGNLYRGLEGGQHLTNKDISLLTSKSNVTQFDPNLNSFVDAAGNPTEYSASFTPNNYNMFNRFSDKFIKPFANQTAVGAQQYGDAMGGNIKTLYGKGQGNLATRIGNLDAKSLGQTVGLASAAAGIYNTWKPGARTQSQLVGDAEAALEASNQQKLLDEGWMGGANTGFFRAAERGGNIGECKECNKMIKHMMKYYKGGSAAPQKMEMGTNPDIMSYLSNLKVGDKFSNLLSTAKDKFGELKSYFNPSDEMPYGLKNVTYRGNKFTRNQNMDEFARLGKNTVVGQDRTYDNSARQNNAGIGYDKKGILSNLGMNHSKFNMMQKHLMAENGGNIDPNSSGDVEIEVEGGETIKTIDGQDKVFTGPPHEQGGIITKANDGDFVYPKGTWSKRHIKRTERQAAIIAKLEEAGVDTKGLV